MKKIVWLNISMIFVLLFAVMATFGTALAGEPPPTPPGEETFFIKKILYASMTAGWEWEIDKSVDQDYLLLSPGQVATVNYAVTLNATPVETAWNVRGTVIVNNKTTQPVYVESITDQLDDGTIINLDCDAILPTTLAAGDKIVCRYDQDLQSGGATKNTATVVYGAGDVLSDDALIDWGAPVDVIDECVDVFDSNVPGGLGEVCAGDSPKTFEYSYDVGPYEVCGLYEINNTAYFMGQDSGAYGEASEVVTVDVPCAGGCTLTPGYWKTHSSYGPAPYDVTWEQIGEDTTFFFSGKSYYQVLWTSPSGGNAYYILAHAYIAAKLNQLNGADFTAAQAAFDQATALFNNPLHTPAYVGGLKGSARNVWINLASTLDSYNNGYLRPGHCSE